MPGRWLQHLTTTHLALRRRFPPAALAAIDARITASERNHRAEIRCAVESVLPVGQLMRGVSSAARAAEVYSSLRMWDTAENNGVLLYVLIAERRFEILADRGFNTLVSPEKWASIAANVEAGFREDRYADGVLSAIDAISAIARQHFPRQGAGVDELPDRTVLL